MTRRYLEDLQVGEKFQTASATVSEAEILEFSRQFDPQPMHLDPVAAAKGPFRGLIASGWHTGAIVMRLVVDANPLGDLPLLGLGVDGIEWPPGAPWRHPPGRNGSLSIRPQKPI